MFQLMSMVGEQFDEHSNEVNGVVLQRRARNDRLAIWVSDTNNLPSVQTIGMNFKSILNLPSNVNIHYEVCTRLSSDYFGLSNIVLFQSHADAQTKASSHKFSLKL